MIYVTVALCFGLLLCGLVGGYLVGRHQANLVEAIKRLERERDEPKTVPAAPDVLGGAYAPPRDVSTAADNRNAGLIESKTPQRLDFETRNAIDKEVLGQ